MSVGSKPSFLSPGKIISLPSFSVFILSISTSPSSVFRTMVPTKGVPIKYISSNSLVGGRLSKFNMSSSISGKSEGIYITPSMSQHLFAS